MTEPNPFLPGPSINDGEVQTFDEYRWAQLVEDNRRHLDAIAALKRRTDDQKDRADIFHRSLINTIERLTFLENAVAELQAKGQPVAKPRDELNERIVEFLESAPGIKFTAIAIRENLGDGKYIHDRCKTLVRQGRILAHTAPNRHPLYQALPTDDQS